MDITPQQMLKWSIKWIVFSYVQSSCDHEHQGNVAPVNATKAYWGEEVQLHAFLMTLNGGQQAALHTGLFNVEKESPEATEQED